MIFCFVVGIKTAVWLVNQRSSQAGSRTSNWMENNILTKLKSRSYSFTAKMKRSVKHNQNVWMSKTVLCPLSLPGIETASSNDYIIGLVEFTLFSDINRKIIKESSFVGKNSSDGQLDSYSCHSRTHNKNCHLMCQYPILMLHQQNRHHDK